jgi:hypothetical protein
MNRKFFGLFAALLLTSFASVLGAVVSLDPTEIVSDGKQTISVAVNISGLGPAPAISGFHVEIGFDSSVVKFQTVSYGVNLGDLLTVQAFHFEDTSSAGKVGLFEISGLDTASLPLQPSSFTLATLTFERLSAGTSPLSLRYDIATGDGISLLDNITPVPEPLAFSLAGVGLLFLSVCRRPFAKPASR